MTREAPQEIKRQLSRWNSQASVLRFINVILGIIATIASILVAAKINSFEKKTIEWLAIIAASSAGLLTSLNMGAKSNRMRDAWRKLNAAVILYEEGGDISLEQLVKEYSDAELLIGNVDIKVK